MIVGGNHVKKRKINQANFGGCQTDGRDMQEGPSDMKAIVFSVLVTTW